MALCSRTLTSTFFNYNGCSITTHKSSTKEYVRRLPTIQMTASSSDTIKTYEEGKLDRPKWSGQTPLSRLVGALISFKPLYYVMKIGGSTTSYQDAQTGMIIGRGTEREGLYYVDEANHQGHTLLARGSPDYQLRMWHKRLGHPLVGYLKHLFPSLHGCNNFSDCETCVLAKSHKHSYFPSISRIHKPFVLVHSDAWGPAPGFNSHGFSYFVLFIDDCTRMCWVYFLKHKSEVFDVFVNFYNMIVTQFQTKPQILRSDNGGEYVNLNMKQFINIHGLIHQTTCPDTPQQNGVAERKNRTLLEITRSLMFESRVPESYWPEALATATYLTNRLPTKTLQFQTPLDTLKTYLPVPSSHSLPPRVFGCVVYVHLPKRIRTKLEPRAIKCVFLGYGTTQKGYRCFDPVENHMYVTMDCEFFEESYYFPQLSSQGENHGEDLSWLTYPSRTDPNKQVGYTTDIASEAKDLHPTPQSTPVLEHPDSIEVTDTIPDIVLTDDMNVDNVNDNPGEKPETGIDVTQGDESSSRYKLPPRSTRGIPPKRYDPDYEAKMSRYLVDQGNEVNVAQTAKAFNTSLYSNKIPRTVEEALQDPKWKKAMEEEIAALMKNDTWEKCELPKGKKTVGCKWVITIKYHSDGTIERYKARLVAKGYTQTYDIDYSETFSPVAKIDTIRVLFSIAANKDWPLHQFDVKNAFLHGELKEEVFMKPPPEFFEAYGQKEGCKLKKALYGLKQSPRAWFGRFTSAMKKFGYKQSNSDHTLFLKKEKDRITCLIIYLDDMVITENDADEIRDLKEKLSGEFDMKDLGNLKYFLGIEVLRSKGGIFISQLKYILDLLAETSMLDCKPADTPITTNHGLQIVEGEKPTDQDRYRRLVGKLIYNYLILDLISHM